VFSLTWDHNVNYWPASNGLRNCSLLGVRYEVKKKIACGYVCDVVSKTKTLLNTDEVRFGSYFKRLPNKHEFCQCRRDGSRTLL